MTFSSFQIVKYFLQNHLFSRVSGAYRCPNVFAQSWCDDYLLLYRCRRSSLVHVTAKWCAKIECVLSPLLPNSPSQITVLAAIHTRRFCCLSIIGVTLAKTGLWRASSHCGVQEATHMSDCCNAIDPLSLPPIICCATWCAAMSVTSPRDHLFHCYCVAALDFWRRSDHWHHQCVLCSMSKAIF